jgi:hypothetical protein
MDIKLVHLRFFAGTNPEGAHSLITWYFNQLQLDNLVKYAYYDGSVKDISTFYKICIDKSVTFFVLYDCDTNEPVAHVMLNGFEGLTCRGHFCILKKHHGIHAEYIGNAGRELIFDLKREDGTPFVTTIVGLTPVKNKIACRFAQKIGFVKKFILPQACYLAYDTPKPSYSDGMISVATATR